MKYLVQWRAHQHHSSEHFENDTQRMNAVLDKWIPPEGLVIHHFLARVDGQGGIAIVEVPASDDGSLLAEAPSVFAPWFSYEIIPMMDIPVAIESATHGRELRHRAG
ncbi:MAG: DUF3303 domain-containing protein [Acidimicrobiales bacterium]